MGEMDTKDKSVYTATVMNPVVTGCVQNILQRANTFHHLGVDPELVEQIQLLVDNGVAWRDEEGHGKVERLKSVF